MVLCPDRRQLENYRRRLSDDTNTRSACRFAGASRKAIWNRLLPKLEIMNLAKFEKEILASARIAVKNKDLKRADIIEWAFGEVVPREDEVAIGLDDVRCNIIIPRKKINGRRKELGLAIGVFAAQNALDAMSRRKTRHRNGSSPRRHRRRLARSSNPCPTPSPSRHHQPRRWSKQ